jgi:hypothetical protein
MVGKYTFTEMADIHIMFDHTYDDKVEACCFYQDAFPGHRIPGRKTFSSIHQHLMERGTFAFKAAE